MSEIESLRPFAVEMRRVTCTTCPLRGLVACNLGQAARSPENAPYYLADKVKQLRTQVRDPEAGTPTERVVEALNELNQEVNLTGVPIGLEESLVTNTDLDGAQTVELHHSDGRVTYEPGFSTSLAAATDCLTYNATAACTSPIPE
jgi:hypothetical protein